MANLEHRFSDSMKGKVTAFYGDYDKLYQNFYAASYSEANSPGVVTLDGYVDTMQRENLILSGNLIKEVSFANMSHRFLLGAELMIDVDTSSDQDRWNTYWSETADDKETFSVARPALMGIIGGVGTNALGGCAQSTTLPWIKTTTLGSVLRWRRSIFKTRWPSRTIWILSWARVSINLKSMYSMCLRMTPGQKPI